jgi:hypothetical protein
VDDGANKTALRFRKAAMKAKQEEEVENMRRMMEKQIEQSLNELKLNQELQRMKTTEEKVTFMLWVTFVMNIKNYLRVPCVVLIF